MRTQLSTIALAAVGATLLATGCSARAHEPTTPRRFDCGGASVVASGSTLIVNESDGTSMTLDRYLRDEDGDHYARPNGIAFTVPRDRREDATMIGGGSRRGVCIVEAGYTDALQRYMRMPSYRAVAQQLALEDGDARKLISRALHRLQVRYHRDR